MSALKVVYIISMVLVVVGALNWGWIGLFNQNPVAELNSVLGDNQYVERTVYVLVGIAGLILAGVAIYYGWKDHKKRTVKKESVISTGW